MALPKFIGRENSLKILRGFFREKSSKGPLQAYHIHISGEAGVGRTRFLEVFLEGEKSPKLLGNFSCAEDPLITQLAESVGLDSRSNEFTLDVLRSQWEEKILGLPEDISAFLVLRDYQDLEKVEQDWVLDFLCLLAKLPRRLFLIFECRSPMESYLLPFSPDREFFLNLEPFDERESAECFQGFCGNKKIDLELKQVVYQHTQGFPEKIWRWADFLSRKVAKFTRKQSLKKWPANFSALLKAEMEALTKEELLILKIMALHPSWVSTDYLSEVGKFKPKQVKKVLGKFAGRQWVRPHSKDKKQYLLTYAALGKVALDACSGEEKKQLHIRCFDFLKSQPDWLFLSTWLAFHAAQGGLSASAYCWNLLAGQAYEQNQKFATAQAYFERCLDFAESRFKQAYALGMMGGCLLQQGRYPRAIEKLQEAYRLAQEIPWPEFQQNYSLNLAQVYCHLGLYREAEKYFQEGLGHLQEMGLEREWVQQCQNLGVAYLEQARYGEAQGIFEKVLEKYQEWGDLLGQITSKIGLVQIFISLGKGKDALVLLEAIEQSMPELPGAIWQPLLKLLLAKYQFTQGNRGKALRILEEAAQGFEEVGDLNGKVEVLLAMSAPLLEYNMIEDAQSLINLLGSWNDLKRYPALQHSIQLRRLAIGAFSGHWNQEDIPLASQDALNVGRAEDWLQFWFHMALASQKLDDPRFFRHFISQARQLTKALGGQLDEISRESFFQRPDIARILRLSDEKKAGAEPRIQARRTIETEEPAEAATLAPPVRGKREKKD